MFSGSNNAHVRAFPRRRRANNYMKREQAVLTFYDASGKIVGRSSTSSSGTVTNYDT